MKEAVNMRFAIDVPNFGPFGDPSLVVDVAGEAEAAGWDAVWVWDHIIRDPAQPVPFADPWILLTAISGATSRIRLGPMMLALPRHRPWVVARQAVTLDHLSHGRLTLGVALGHPAGEFALFGEEFDLRVRAEKLDEGLTILSGLWSGRQFEHHGRHFDLSPMTFLPEPFQKPRIPIWLGGTWPIKAPLRRAANWDGVWPETRDANGVAGVPSPDQIRELIGFVREHRTAEGPFDVMVAGYTSGAELDPTTRMLREYAEAGATWWTERINPRRGTLEDMLARVRVGPPRP